MRARETSGMIFLAWRTRSRAIVLLGQVPWEWERPERRLRNRMMRGMTGDVEVRVVKIA